MAGKQITKGEQKRGRMEVLINCFFVIAAILTLLTTVFLYYHLQTPTIWTVFFAIVFLALAFCSTWQVWVWKQTDIASTQPSKNKPTLEQPTFTEDIKQCVFDFGGNPATAPIDVLEKHPIQPYSVNGISPVMYVKNHKFYVDIIVSAPDKSLPVQIKEGKLTVTPANWDTNSNESAFEVVDEKLDVVFQIIYHKPSKIVLYGVFPDPQVKGQLIYVSEKGVQAMLSKPKDFFIKRQFKYPSWKYPGQFDEP